MKPKQIKSGSRVFRDIVITREMVNAEDRTVELSFSSEEPYERWWGVEILDHGKGSMRVDRLASGAAPLLVNHNWEDQVGVIEKLLSSESKGRALVRFSRSARGDEIFNDVADGIRTCVSVGYIVHKSILEKEEEGIGTYRIADWEPFEVSIVSVPADTTVGVGRGFDTRSLIEFLQPEETTMKDPKTPAADETRAAEKINAQKIEQRARDTERQRVADIAASGKAFKDFGGNELASEYIANGKSLAEFQRAMQERVSEKGSTVLKTAEIGMSQKEVRQFSFIKAINAMANQSDRRAQEAAAFEFECSAAAAKALKKDARGIMVPFDVLRRGLTVGDPAQAGNLVDDVFRVDDFISMLRNAMVIPILGVRMLPGLVGDITLPRQIGSNTAYWVEEGNDVGESMPEFDQVKMRPRTLGGFTEISRKLLLQSSIEMEGFVRNEIATTIGLELERAAIFGSGSGEEPTGIANMTGVGSVVGGTDGAAPTWQHMVDLETMIAVANALTGNMGYLTNAKVRGKLKTTLKAANVPGFIWGEGDTPINGYRAEVTNMVPANLTKGAGTNLSAIVFGNWADMMIGLWGGLDITVDPYTKATSGTIRVVGLQDVDVAVRRIESFSRFVDVITI
ncbi:MAG: phage major capsid protein [Burkholderiales bacterium]|jgi:HK97 family phage major capsid protein/HK97 family phage prohead protease|nr:phage major capsid protein [Burkholderiales bacterium]